MIRYALRCTGDHRFETWFGSSADFDRLHRSGLVSCCVCGSTEVAKELMAPAVNNAAPSAGLPVDLRAPASPAEQALTELRRKIEAQAENVGGNFVREARAIHEGRAPGRAIIGEARPAEAKKLLEDGIPVAPLPWSARKAN